MDPNRGMDWSSQNREKRRRMDDEEVDPMDLVGPAISLLFFYFIFIIIPLLFTYSFHCSSFSQLHGPTLTLSYNKK